MSPSDPSPHAWEVTTPSLERRTYHVPDRRSPNRDIRLPVPVVVTGYGDVAQRSQPLRLGGHDAVAGAQDIPRPGRRSPNREVRLPVPVVVTGYGDVAQRSKPPRLGRSHPSLERRTYHVPDDGLQTAKSVFPSPSKSPTTGCRPAIQAPTSGRSRRRRLCAGQTTSRSTVSTPRHPSCRPRRNPSVT